MNKSLYWHDYETFGIDPKKDRIVQFAGVRTDEDLNVIGDPLVIYCKPANDFLPQPESCMITGISPQLALEKGIIESKFIEQINEEFSKPGTCVLGYNSIRFDDEFTRYSLYRNFFDPYAREWQNGNSRWDIIDLVRLARALRPDGVVWPVYKEGENAGKPSMRLEDLSVANGIAHESAHDALSDVYATIAVARLIKEKQPRLFDYVYQHRQKRQMLDLVNPVKKTPVIHISGMYPAEFGSAALVAPVAMHPTNKNAVIVYDLRFDPAPLLTLGHEEIKKRLFTPKQDMPEGVERIPLKTIHVNKCPVVVPLSTLDTAASKKLKIDLGESMKHLQVLLSDPGLITKLHKVYSSQSFEKTDDPDQSLYGGSFFSTEDKRKMELIRQSDPNDLENFKAGFSDPRIPEMLFRYRARNYPQTLSEEDQLRWNEYRKSRLSDVDGGASIIMAEYFEKIDELKSTPDLADDKIHLLDELVKYGEAIKNSL